MKTIEKDQDFSLMFQADCPIEEIGSDSPEIYILTDPADNVNIRQGGKSLTKDEYFGIRNSLLNSQLFSNEKDFLSKVRIASCLKYPTREISSKVLKSRDVTNQDLEFLSPYVRADIEECKPKVIIAFGDEATKVITNFKYRLAEKAISGSRFYYNGIPVLFAKSLKSTFFVKHEPTKRKLLSSINGKIIQAKNLIQGIDPQEMLNNLSYERIDAFKPEEVRRLFDIFMGHSELVLDYETSGLNTYIEGFHLAGIGLCSLDRSKSVYIRFYDFDRLYDHSREDLSESLEIINSFFQLKDFVVFNKQYEQAVTISPSVGINLNLKTVHDDMMWLRCLGTPSSLKDACVNRLGVDLWNDDVDEWVGCINEIVKIEKPTATMKGQRKEIEWMMEDGNGLFDMEKHYKKEFNNLVISELRKIQKKGSKIIESLGMERAEFKRLRDYLEDNKIRLKDSKQKEAILEEIREKNFSQYFYYEKGKSYFLKKKDKNLLSQIKKIEDICLKTYESKSRIEEISHKLSHRIYRFLENHIIFDGCPYSEVPIEIMEPYCIADCNFTAELHKVLKKELKEKNLEKAAEVYNRHAYLGYILTRNGIAWDDALATELEKEYSKIRIESLRSLITLPRMVKALHLNSIQLLNVRSTTNLDELKAIFNPNSSYKYTGADEHKNTNYRMSKVIGTPRFKLALMLYEVYDFLNQTEDEDLAKKEFPTFFPIYKTLLEKDFAEDRVKYLDFLLENAEGSLKEPFIANMKRYGRTKEVDLKQSYVGWKVDSMAHENTQKLFDIFVSVFGTDADDDSTWVEEFYALYYFKVFKKVEKSIGTYLNGNIGRNSVEIVELKDIDEDCPLRKCNYFERKADPEREVYINRTSWGVCTADTKRWQASQHTVPKSTELMDLRTSRFPDGIKLHYDYSQAEVRVLATIAEDENLLQAFIDGLDIHLYNASRMWGKPMEEITPTERSMAKGLTFSLLYGASEAEFANKFTKGNIEEARKIIQSFFAAYPKVKKFIYEMHKHGTFHDNVPTLFGDPLHVNMPSWVKRLKASDKLRLIDNPYDYSVKIFSKEISKEDERKERAKFAKSLRNSQNYCIQGTSSTLAGLAMEEFQRHIERESLSTKLECFTHDSCDADLRLRDLIKTLKLLPVASVEYLRDEYKIPMKVDVGIGVSNNKIVELHAIDILDDRSLTCEFEGKEEALNELKDKIERNGGSLEYEVKKSKEGMISIRDLFVTTNAYAKAMGTPYKTLSGNLKITI
jgi:DNA polymerase I-like protein with 3'-5' exonuclease and polymerase domains